MFLFLLQCSPLFEAEVVCDHGNKFAIGGFPFYITDRISEKLLQSFKISAVPGHLDGVADLLVNS